MIDDINAMNVFLRLGHSKADAINVFEKIFSAKKPENIERFKKIKEYIERFENGK